MTKTQANEPSFVPTEAMLDVFYKRVDVSGCGIILNVEEGLAAVLALAAAPIVPAPAYGVKEALEPFAKAADFFDIRAPLRPHQDDHEIVAWTDHRIGDRTITVGDLRRACTAYNAIGSGVKGLDWVDAPAGNQSSAHCEIGLYVVAKRLDGSFRVSSWRIDQGGKDCDNHVGNALTLDEAKAAAQADFERRILSCLSPAPVEEADAKAREPQNRADAMPGQLWARVNHRGKLVGICEFVVPRWDEYRIYTPPASTIPSEPEAKGEARGVPSELSAEFLDELEGCITGTVYADVSGTIMDAPMAVEMILDVLRRQHGSVGEAGAVPVGEAVGLPWRVEGSIYEHMEAEIVGENGGIAQVWKGPRAWEIANFIVSSANAPPRPPRR